MEPEEILARIGSLKEEAMKVYKADIKGIFGSYVRGDQTHDSDIDVLVEFQDEADLFNYVGLSQLLEKHLDRKVDIVPLSSLREEIKPYVLQEAVYL